MKYNDKKRCYAIFFLNFETTHHLGLPTGQTQINIVGIPTWLFLVCSPRDSTQIIFSKRPAFESRRKRNYTQLNEK